MKKIAIVGAGPAGAYLAILLAEKGIPVLLFDPKTPWEKPCGGGLTFKTFLEFPVFSTFKDCQEVTHLKFVSPHGRECRVVSDEPLRICARESLGEFLLARAQESGVRFLQSRVEGLKRNGRWTIRTVHGDFEADFLVGADGATSLVRRALGMNREPGSMTLGVGTYLPQTFGGEVLIKFLAERPGYFWVFPRRNHSSIGLCATARFLQGQELFDQLDRFIEGYLQVPLPEKVARYGSQIPIFRRFVPRETAGENWALVGDAAGLVDPITKEGIYYALKSAALLAQALEGSEVGPSYLRLLRETVLGPFRRARLLRRLFYQPWFLERMVASGGSNPTVNGILADLISGRQNYQGLGRRLLSAILKSS